MIQPPEKLVLKVAVLLRILAILSLLSKKTAYMSRYLLFYFKMTKKTSDIQPSVILIFPKVIF